MKLRILLAIFAMMIPAVFGATQAQAQATRTWVSGVGDDANPCSRTAPCKTFAGAISKTAAGGQINCLDPGGFGGVTITKALSIVCEFTEGGILSAGAGVSGIIVNAGVNDDIYLRGLDLHGAGTAQNGVRFLAGGSLTIENSTIRSYQASNGVGVSFQPSGTSRLMIINTTISNNGAAGTGAGILIQPTGANGTARVVLNNVRVQESGLDGVRISTAGNSAAAGIGVTIMHSEFSGNANGINVAAVPGTTIALVMVDDTAVSNNTTTGILGDGGNVLLRVANSVITGNARGVNALNGASVGTYGNNRLIGNPITGAGNDGAFTGAVIPGN